MRRVVLALLAGLAAEPALAQNQVTFPTFVTSKATASALGATDYIPVIQGGVTKKILGSTVVVIGQVAAFTPRGTSSAPQISLGEATTGIFSPAAHTLALSTACQDATAPHCWGPVILEDTGNLTLGSPFPTSATPQSLPNHSGIEINVNDLNYSNGGSRVPITIANFVPGSAAIEPYISWRTRGTWASKAAGTYNAGSSAVQAGDSVMLFQGQAEDGFATNNTVVGNFALRVMPGGTVSEGVVPGQFYMATKNNTTGLVATDFTFGQHKLGMLTDGCIAAGGSNVCRISVAGVSSNELDITARNLSVTGTITGTIALPTAGINSIGGYVPFELSAQNILLQNGSPCGTSWTAVNTTAGAASNTTPAGGTDATTLTSSASGGYCQQVIAIASDTSSYAISAYYPHSGQTATTDALNVAFCALINSCAGAAVVATVSYTIGLDRQSCTIDAGASCTVTALGDWDWVQIRLTNDSQPYMRIRAYVNGGSGAASNNTIWCPQVEKLPTGAVLATSSASSCIRTTTVPVTRPTGINVWALGLAVTDPHVLGVLWNNNGVLTASQG